MNDALVGRRFDAPRDASVRPGIPAPASGIPRSIATGRSPATLGPMETAGLNDVVLVVDDAPSIVETVSFLLEAKGFPTLTAADGQAGLDLALLHRPRVVVVDANMPVLDGYGLCRALRATPALAGCYIVFITGDVQATIRRRAVEAGADLYMQKPIDAEKLESVVAEAFAGTRVSEGTSKGVRVVVRTNRRPAS